MKNKIIKLIDKTFMNICNDCNITFNERHCPLCEAKEKIIELEEELEGVMEELDQELNNR